MSLLAFAEAPGLAFSMVVGLGEVFVFQKATSLFQGVSRKAF